MFLEPNISIGYKVQKKTRYMYTDPSETKATHCLLFITTLVGVVCQLHMLGMCVGCKLCM